MDKNNTHQIFRGVLLSTSAFHNMIAKSVLKSILQSFILNRLHENLNRNQFLQSQFCPQWHSKLETAGELHEIHITFKSFVN